MFGSLMMFASGVLASSPSSASASRRAARSAVGNCARMRPASEMSRSSTSTPAGAGERLDDRQQRVRRERGRLVGVRVDDLHRGATRYYSSHGVRPTRPPSAPRQGPGGRPLLRAARRRRPRPGGAGCSRAHFSREFRRAFGESPHQYLLTRRLERAAALLRNTDRSVADICFSVGLQSVGSFTTSFTRTFGKSPTAYRAEFPPASHLARVPACVLRVYGRPQRQHVSKKTGAAARP